MLPCREPGTVKSELVKVSRDQITRGKKRVAINKGNYRILPRT